MTVLTNALTWADTSDPKEPIAPYLIQFGADPSWIFPNLYGVYQHQSIYPDGVVIDNSANNATLTVTIGSNTSTVSPFQRGYIDFVARAESCAFACPTAVAVPIQFYKGPPPAGMAGINQAGAIGVANANLFIGGVSTEIGANPNTQAITVVGVGPFAFVNGALICYTSGFTNTGPLTLRVNGGAALNVVKVSAAGEVPLANGDLPANCNLILQCNATSGNLEVVSNLPATIPAVGTAWTPIDVSGAGLVFAGVSASFVQIGNLIFATFSFAFPVTGDGTQIKIGGLPVAAANQDYSQTNAVVRVIGAAGYVTSSIIKNTTTFNMFVNNGALGNNSLSGITCRGILIYPVN